MRIALHNFTGGEVSPILAARYDLPPGPAYTPEEAAADAAALEAGEKKGDAPAEDIVDVDPEDLGEAPKNTAAPRKDDVTDADVVVEDGKPRA